jgi:WD40 repeat protein/tRNA A-37 threonylcarbamoyl transferase component Bud32
VDRDRNLIFGVFAVQLHKISSAQLVEVATAWLTEPTKDISTRLVDAGYLKPSDRDFIQGLVDHAVASYGGDAAATLNAVGGEQQIQDTFSGSIVLTASGGVGTAPTVLASEDSLPGATPGVQEAPGRYKHVSEYARGGMGRVLLVHDEHLGRDIALKELLPSLIGSDSTSPTPVRGSAALLSRFLQEARITGQLEHPAIVPVYELGRRGDGALYYTMKLVRGRTLSKAIKEAATLEGRLKLLPHFVDLCQAIAYAHSRGVIHRDLKPANVMVGEFGETVVLDWGLAKVKGREDVHADGLAATIRAMNVSSEDDSAKTAYGHALGTPAYMPPEQARGQLDQIDERSDIYSLGAVLYELLTGQTPYRGNTTHEILYKVLEESSEPIAKSTPTAPPELAAICERALKRSAGQRYQSAREFADEIGRFQSGALVQAHAYTPAQLMVRFVRRYRAIVATAAAALLVVVAVTIFYLVQISATNRKLADARDVAVNRENEAVSAREKETAALTKANQTIQELEETNYVSTIRLAEAALLQGDPSLSRRRLLETPARLRNWEWGYLYGALDTSDITLAGYSLNAAFSPDSRRIVTGVVGDKLFYPIVKIWDVESGVETASLSGTQNSPQSVSFSPDGARVIAPCQLDTQVWDATTGKIVFNLPCADGELLDACFSPDGKYIATTSDASTTTLWDSSTGKKMHSLPGNNNAGSAMFSPDGNRIATALAGPIAKIWDSETGAELATLSGQQGEVAPVHFSPNGALIACEYSNGTSRIWSAKTGTDLCSIVGTDISFSPDGTRVLSNSNDKRIDVWSTETHVLLFSLLGHTRAISDARFTPDSKRIVTASYDGSLRIWDSVSGRELYKLIGARGGIDNLAVSSNSARLAAITRFGVKMWDVNALYTPHKVSVEADERFTSASLSLDVKKASINFLHTSKVLDVLSGKELTSIDVQPDAPNSLYKLIGVLNADGTRLATSSSSKNAQIWDVKTGTSIAAVESVSEIGNAAFGHDSTRLLTVSGEDLHPTADVWDGENGKHLLTYSGHTAWLSCAAIQQNGALAITMSAMDDFTAKLWDVNTGSEVSTLRDPKSKSGFFAIFNRTGEQILTASTEGPATIWNVETGKPVQYLVGHNDAIMGAGFSPDSTRISTCAVDGTTRIWDVHSGTELLTLTENLERASSTAFTDDGLCVVAVSGRREHAQIQTWRAIPYVADAWHNDESRSELIRLARREFPNVKTISVEPATAAVEDSVRKFESLASEWEKLNGNGQAAAYRGVPNQGIYIESATSFPSIPEFVFADHDLLSSINNHPIYSLSQAAAALREFVAAKRVSKGESAVFTIEVFNTYEHNAYVLEFPGLVENEVRMKRENLLELLDEEASPNESNETPPFYIGDKLRTELGLNQFVQYFAIDNRKSDSWTKVIGVISDVKKRIANGSSHILEITARREATNQYIHTHINIDP